MRSYEHLKGSEPARQALDELVRLGRRTIVAYRAAERSVADHRMQAALAQLRRDHARHVRELARILAEIGGAGDGLEGTRTRADGGVIAAADANAEIPEEVRRLEMQLRDAYARHVERAYPEPLRAVLSRHQREEEAHVEWLAESRWWPGSVRTGEITRGA